DAGPVAHGGPDLRHAGLRAVPSLRYLYRQPPFSIGPDSAGDNDHRPSLAQQALRAADAGRAPKTAAQPQAAAADLVPQGGLFWDGRVDTLEQQADGPLFNPDEMAAGTPAQVLARIKAGGYAADFQRLFGARVFDDPRQALAEALFAISRFEIEDPSFHPFTSKFDAWLAGRARLSAAEWRGYLAFNDPKKGNCAACHLDRPSRDGLPPLFTDHQYEALGVPRNNAIPANRDPGFFDLGLCGPLRHDLAAQTRYCGMFLTPSLRNVATRRVFFHNGVFHSLRQVLTWYAGRDLQPQRFYPRGADGRVARYDDLPPPDRANVDHSDAPFDRHRGDAPALDAADIDDLIAFLGTLTDADAHAAAEPARPGRDGPPGRRRRDAGPRS
ncbi:MAG: cytochrome-c peroxidase, partial [Burkholderiales bacterium]|nr:cytochrome-c peroxidase [Burkholderiales bacterium]